ncbi:MAG TPA: hypothetical protein VGR00_10870, partial [Thermoanaerobaculia bacterium]|nr:hypothetical protein [Thermoanaerobaculia bacterium]
GADSGGDFVVAWQAQTSTVDGSYSAVLARRFSAAGTGIGLEFRVNSYTTGSQISPAVARNGSGTFLVAWQSTAQDGNQDGVFGQLFDNGGAQVGGEFRVNAYTTSVQRNPAVASDAAGNFVVTWEDRGSESNYGVFGRRYDAGGSPLGTEFHVNTYTTGPQYFSAVATDPSGRFVVVWASYDSGVFSTGINGQRFCTALAAVTINVNGSTTVCPTGTGGLATVTDSGGGTSTHQWGYRTTPAGMTITDIAGQTMATYTLNGADFPGAGTYYLVCRTTPACGSMTTSNEVTVTVDASDATAPVVTPPAAATATQTLCQ